MNFQCKSLSEPLKVFITNTFSPASQLLAVKILSGVVFGKDQMIDLTLLVYSNEIKFAEAFKLELESCAFSYTNSIDVTSDLPSVSDGDVFCFVSDFANPNCFDFNKEHDEFNSLYLITKLANNFTWTKDYENSTEAETEKSVHFVKKRNDNLVKNEPSIKIRRPIFVTDGLVTLDILKSLSHDIPADLFFCPTSIPPIAKAILGEYLTVQSKAINEVHVWAANDEVFHVEVEKPLIIHDRMDDSSPCDADMIGKHFKDSLNLDTTQFNASWMKKEFIEKVAASASKNPYGCIYRAAEFARTLRNIWITRTRDDDTKVYNNMGVISDGSIGTIKGYPYVLPLTFCKGIWEVNHCFEEDTYLKQEIKRINKAVKNHHQKLIPYCKKFLQDNVINQALRSEDESELAY